MTQSLGEALPEAIAKVSEHIGKMEAQAKEYDEMLKQTKAAMSDPRTKALKAFEALRADVEQFDDHPRPDGSSFFSDKVPLYMKSYLVNWLRNFVRDHGDEVQNALKSEKQT